jgi:energy-converting hydrogenase Eha subunit F
MARGVKGKRKIANHEYDELKSNRIKRVFYIFLDIIILVSFSLALYFTCTQDYTKTILYLIMGTLLLIFFIVKKAFKGKRLK